MNSKISEIKKQWGSEDDSRFEEKWLVVMNTKGEYILSKLQAKILKQAIAT